jgi:alpha-D-xyloside xylohydrolase
MFYAYPDDEACWTVDDQYLFGNDVVVAPVVTPGAREREVFLPSGTSWVEVSTGRVHEGGQITMASAPLDVIPVFVRQGAAPLVIEALSRGAGAK